MAKDRACIPSLQVSPKIKKLAEKAAKAAGCATVTEWARNLVLRELEGQPKEPGEGPTPQELLEAVWREAHIGLNGKPIRAVNGGSLKRAIETLKGVIAHSVGGSSWARYPLRAVFSMYQVEWEYVKEVASFQGESVDHMLLKHAFRSISTDAPARFDSRATKLHNQIDAIYEKEGRTNPWYPTDAELKEACIGEDCSFWLLTFNQEETNLLREVIGKEEAKAGERIREWLKDLAMKRAQEILGEDPELFRDTVLKCHACGHQGKDPEFRDETGGGKATCPSCGNTDCMPINDLSGVEVDTTEVQIDVLEKRNP